MATARELDQIIEGITEMYSIEASPIMRNIWNAAFTDADGKDVFAALMDYFKSPKSSFKPSPGDILQIMFDKEEKLKAAQKSLNKQIGTDRKATYTPLAKVAWEAYSDITSPPDECSHCGNIGNHQRMVRIRTKKGNEISVPTSDVTNAEVLSVKPPFKWADMEYTHPRSEFLGWHQCCLPCSYKAREEQDKADKQRNIILKRVG